MVDEKKEKGIQHKWKKKKKFPNFQFKNVEFT